MIFKWTPLIALLAAFPLFAHHGTAGADTSKVVTLQGVVTQIEWANPHVTLHLEVKESDGKPVSWNVTISPPGHLRRAGVTQDSLKIGTEVTVEVYPDKVGSHHARVAGFLTLPDGKKINESGGLAYGSTSCTPGREPGAMICVVEPTK